jgi:Rod binding domain-containing protein
MTALSLAAPQIDPTAGASASSAAELARRGQIHQTAQKFEASFLTSMLQTMFKSVTTAPPFGGGPGEDMWKSFLAEAMAKDMARRGGVGVAASVEREMLKLQGMNDPAQAAAGAPSAAPSKASAAAASAGSTAIGLTYPGLPSAAQKVAVAPPRWPAVDSTATSIRKMSAPPKAPIQ